MRTACVNFNVIYFYSVACIGSAPVDFSSFFFAYSALFATLDFVTLSIASIAISHLSVLMSNSGLTPSFLSWYIIGAVSSIGSPLLTTLPTFCSIVSPGYRDWETDRKSVV